MSGGRRLAQIKVTLDEDAEPGLFRVLAGVKVTSRARRLLALANLGAIVELQGIQVAQPRGVEPGPALVVADTVVVAQAVQAKQLSAVEALGEGLDDFLSNLSAPLSS